MRVLLSDENVLPAIVPFLAPTLTPGNPPIDLYFYID